MSVLGWGLGVLGVVAALAASLVVAGQLGAFVGSPRGELGWRDGRLAPPSVTPNSVSSQAALYPDHPQRAYSEIAPFAAGVDALATLRRIEQVVGAMPGARMIETQPGYLRAEFRSRWLGFVDDVEFAVDETVGVIQVRSASRLGRGDLGVNRARIEAIRARLTQG